MAGKALTAQGNALAAQVAPPIETHFVVYDIATHEEEFKHDHFPVLDSVKNKSVNLMIS